jgi:hypothetical protein
MGNSSASLYNQQSAFRFVEALFLLREVVFSIQFPLIMNWSGGVKQMDIRVYPQRTSRFRPLFAINTITSETPTSRNEIDGPQPG